MLKPAVKQMPGRWAGGCSRIGGSALARAFLGKAGWTQAADFNLSFSSSTERFPGTVLRERFQQGRGGWK